MTEGSGLACSGRSSLKSSISKSKGVLKRLTLRLYNCLATSKSCSDSGVLRPEGWLGSIYYKGWGVSKRWWRELLLH